MSARAGIPQASHKATLIDADTRWQEHANCFGLDVDEFYPDRGVVSKTAQKVCDHCDVWAECLAFAIKNNERDGIWGGVSEARRREIRRGWITVADVVAQRNDRIRMEANA